MRELSVYHQRNVEEARERVADLRAKKLIGMDADGLLLWLTRMEVVGQDLLNVVDLLLAERALAQESREVPHGR